MKAGAPDRFPGAFVHASSFVDDDVLIGPGTHIWHFCHILERARIGENCIIGQNVMIGQDVTVGNGCKIQNNVSLYPGVSLEDDVFCGPSCVFTNVLNPRAAYDRREERLPTPVRRGATIGANATIICGNELGPYCFVGAGSVVSESVPAFALVVGNPAHRIGWMSRAGARLGDDLVCPLEGVRYRLAGPDHLEMLV